MSYNWLTFSQIKTALANRLSDSNKIFWLDDELGRIVKESLRTWNSISQFYKDRTVFSTQNNFSFYDLTSNGNPNSITAGVGALTSTMLGYSIKDRDIINDIEYHLIEPINITWASWIGTDQFTMDDLTRAIERRRNLFQLQTGLNLSHSQQIVPAGNGRVSLSNSIQIIRRLNWLSSDSTPLYSQIYRSDEEEANNLLPNWQVNSGTPENYSAFLTNPVGIQLIPSPSSNGTLDLITINNPSDLNEQTGVLLNIPDDFAWVIKWGALSDLLSRDGQAFDPIRSDYCQKRWEEGIRFASISGTILTASIDGNIIPIEDISEFDHYNPSWQNDSSSSPLNLAILGRNLISLSPTPDSNPHSIQLDIVRNMPVPTASGDFIQIGREHLEPILDYSTHLAFFKCGWAEFSQTIPLANNFMSQAMLHNRQLQAEAKNYSIMEGYSQKEEIHKRKFIKEEAA